MACATYGGIAGIRHMCRCTLASCVLPIFVEMCIMGFLALDSFHRGRRDCCFSGFCYMGWSGTSKPGGGWAVGAAAAGGVRCPTRKTLHQQTPHTPIERVLRPGQRAGADTHQHEQQQATVTGPPRATPSCLGPKRPPCGRHSVGNSRPPHREVRAQGQEVVLVVRAMDQ